MFETVASKLLVTALFVLAFAICYAALSDISTARRRRNRYNPDDPQTTLTALETIICRELKHETNWNEKRCENVSIGIATEIFRGGLKIVPMFSDVKLKATDAETVTP